MKLLYSFTPALILSAAITLFLANTSSSPYKPNNSPSGEIESISEFSQYEFQRLRDPETGKIPANIHKLELEYASTLPGYIAPTEKGIQDLTTLNWKSRGPWNVGGRTRAFAIDVANANKFLAGSTSGGMWTSTTGGSSWNQTWGVAHQSVSCIAQDTRTGKTNTWYIGTGEGYGQSATGGGAYYLGNGMYKSTDGGQTWNSLAATTSGTPQTFDNVWDIIWNTATNPADAVKIGRAHV